MARPPISSAAYAARAITVSCGLTVVEDGNTEASQTCTFIVPYTRNDGSTTPLRAFSEMGLPPCGWAELTLTSLWSPISSWMRDSSLFELISSRAEGGGHHPQGAGLEPDLAGELESVLQAHEVSFDGTYSNFIPFPMRRA